MAPQATGAQIAAARALLGWSQSELAEAAGTNEAGIAFWERSPIIKLLPGASFSLARIHRALAEAGVEITTDGVRFIAKARALSA